MKKALVIVPLLALIGLASTCDGAAIYWANTSPATDFGGTALTGTRRSGAINLSNGDLLQLYKAVGAIDDPKGQAAAYANTAAGAGINWAAAVDADVLLDSIHAGYGVGPPGGAANGMFSRNTSVDIIPGDVIYVRAYNVNPTEWDAAALNLREVGIRNAQGAIVSNAVERIDIPVTYYFNDLKTEPIPEPATLLFMVPGLAIWALRRKK